jgi:hypothetical protein
MSRFAVARPIPLAAPVTAARSPFIVMDTPIVFSHRRAAGQDAYRTFCKVHPAQKIGKPRFIERSSARPGGGGILESLPS